MTTSCRSIERVEQLRDAGAGAHQMSAIGDLAFEFHEVTVEQAVKGLRGVAFGRSSGGVQFGDDLRIGLAVEAHGVEERQVAVLVFEGCAQRTPARLRTHQQRPVDVEEDQSAHQSMRRTATSRASSECGREPGASVSRTTPPVSTVLCTSMPSSARMAT